MLPSQILPLLAVPGTDEVPRLVVETRAGSEAFSGWLMDRNRNVVARLLNFRFRFLGFDQRAETDAAFRCRITADLPEEPAPVPLALGDARLVRRGNWQLGAAGLVGEPVPGTRIAFHTSAPRVTLRFVTGPMRGIVQVMRGDTLAGELDLFDTTDALPRDLTVENPGGEECEIALAPTGRRHAEAIGGSIVLAGIDEYCGPVGPAQPRPRVPGPVRPPLLPGFPQALAALPAEARALNIGGGPGHPDDPRYINLDWQLYEGPDLLADPLALPFRANSFDLVQCNGGINHVMDPQRLVREIHRVLKPGGQAFIAAQPGRWRRFGRPHHIDLSPEALRRLCAGFSEVRVSGSGGIAERVEGMMRWVGLDGPEHAAELAQLKAAAAALAAKAPAKAQAALAFDAVAELRK